MQQGYPDVPTNERDFVYHDPIKSSQRSIPPSLPYPENRIIPEKKCPKKKFHFSQAFDAPEILEKNFVSETETETVLVWIPVERMRVTRAAYAAFGTLLLPLAATAAVPKGYGVPVAAATVLGAPLFAKYIYDSTQFQFDMNARTSISGPMVKKMENMIFFKPTGRSEGSFELPRRITDYIESPLTFMSLQQISINTD